MKAYIVTSGYYSDYRIESVTLRRDIAEAIQKTIMDSNIEEYEVVDDETLIQKAENYIQIWRVVFEENGTIADSFLLGYAETWRSPIVRSESHVFEKLAVDVYCDDEEKARKIASDERATYLAKKFGLA